MTRTSRFAAFTLVAIFLVHAQCMGACGAGLAFPAPEKACHEAGDGNSPADKPDRPGLCADEQALELRMQASLQSDSVALPIAAADPPATGATPTTAPTLHSSPPRLLIALRI